MKKLIISIILFTTIISLSYAQESKTDFKPNGQIHFKVFWNYHTDLSNNATKTSAFELKRSYFGYKYNFSNDITAKITFDVGKDNGGSAYTTFLKIAELDWKVANGVKLSFGIIGLKQFNNQEHFWGYRYLFKSFQDQNKFGSSADAGVNAEFKLAKTLKFNFLIVNGEGYKKLQDVNGFQKFGADLVFKPIKSLTTKIYVDAQGAENSKTVTNLALFAGYRGKGWRVGAEYNKLSNGKTHTSPANDHNLDGVSIYSTVAFNKKWEIFGRFDQLNSNTLVGDTQAWNINKNGSQIIFGIQASPIKGLKFALNYQGYSFDNPTINTKSLVFLNAEFKL